MQKAAERHKGRSAAVGSKAPRQSLCPTLQGQNVSDMAHNAVT